jgi:hypothetical protein
MNVEKIERSAATKNVRPKARFFTRYTVEIPSANCMILKCGKSLNSNKSTFLRTPSLDPQTPPAGT